ncbi:MAG: hypothetical protein AAGD92_13910 [Pseudomonadota bacterium]
MRFSLVGFALIASSCATTSVASSEHAGYGFLSPDPDREPVLIGVYQSKKECSAAVQAWMSRQVVGNPVRAECYPVDKS